MIPKSTLPRALLGAALYLLVALAIRKLGPSCFAPDTVARLGGMWIAVPSIVIANALPKKKMIPLDRLASDLAEVQALRRFVAWALVLGGIGFMLAYALAPLAVANSMATALMAIAVIATGMRIVWSARRPG
jgi:hypothetical protein